MNIIGHCISNHYYYQDNTPIHAFIDGEQDADMQPSLFFRPLIRMNFLERIALNHCKGKILDIGAAAGCHSLILQKRGLHVTALEISEEACRVMQERGIDNILNADLYQHDGKYDSLLLLMNGFGLARSKVGLIPFLKHLKGMLNEDGQIIGDSTDILYHFSKQQNVSKEYYGEVIFKLKYKKEQEQFQWLYADEQLLRQSAAEAGLSCETIKRNNNGAFLVRLTVQS